MSNFIAPQTTEQPSRYPTSETFLNAMKLAIKQDKPILMDYWISSLKKQIVIGVKPDTDEKLLVKSKEEYTSPIAKIYTSTTEFIIMTENSIYIVDNQIESRKIAPAAGPVLGEAA